MFEFLFPASRLYFKITDTEISARNIKTGKIIKEAPFLALKTANGGKMIVAAGTDAKKMAESENVVVMNVFTDSRRSVKLEEAEALFKFMMRKIMESRSFISPKILIHTHVAIDPDRLREIGDASGAQAVIVRTDPGELSERVITNLLSGGRDVK